MVIPNDKKRKIYAIAVCIVLFVLASNIRLRVLFDFCCRFTDADQLVLWDAANDMRHGVFHEPCFYGQAYNPLFEPLFAQPLLWIGISLQTALPIISAILGFLPYILLGWACMRKQKYITAAFTFAYLLWLPLQFHAVTTMPRGYIPACAFATIGIYFGLFTRSRSRFFWFGFFTMFAYASSENSLFLMFPVGVYLFLHHFKEIRFYVFNVLGWIAAAPLPLFVWWFYKTHPAYNLHQLELTFGYDTFLESMKSTTLLFKDFTPIESHKLLTISLFFLVFLLICLIKKNFKASVAILSGLAMFYFALAFDKSHDASNTIFFSGIRMYLGIPISFVVFCYWAESSFKENRMIVLLQPYLLSAFLVLGIVCSVARNLSFQNELYHYSKKDPVILADWVSQMKLLTDHTNDYCKEYHSSLVVIDDWRTGLNYMAPALDYQFKTLTPSYERRTWEMQSEDTTIRDCFIFFTDDPDKMYDELANKIDFTPLREDPYAFLIYTHKRKVFDILREIGTEVRSH